MDEISATVSPVIYCTTRRVEFADTDMAGIMHFAKFFTFMEEVEHEFLRSRGLSVVMTHEGKRIGWPRVSASCDFFKPVVFEEIIEIQLTLTRVGRKSLNYAFEFRKNGEEIARGRLATCCCLVGTSQGMVSYDMPAEIKRKLAEPPDPSTGPQGGPVSHGGGQP